MYADDTQLYKSVPPSDIVSLVHKFEACISEVKTWMISNKLQLNNDKTECLLINTKCQNDVTGIDQMHVRTDVVSFTPKAKNLGIVFDHHLTMESHINTLSKVAYLELRKIITMAPYLSEAAKKTLVPSFILSRLDYCNSLLINLPSELIDKLQRLQNNDVKMVMKKSKRDHVKPL